MIENSFLLASFLSGVAAFFAPCAVALLPGYLSVFISGDSHKKDSKRELLSRSLGLGSTTIAGIATIYAIIGTLLVLIAELIKPYLPYVVIVLGALTIVLGIFMLFGKNISLPVHGPQGKRKNELAEAYVFGLAYGLTALGCLFPFFLITVTVALSAGPLGWLYILAYAVGMSVFMLAFYVLAVVAKTFLQKNVRRIMPYITRVGGLLVVLAGLYIIWYQSVFI